jgi:hypothetical protein
VTSPEQARQWCVEVGLPALAALPAAADPTPWAEGLVRLAQAGDVGLVRSAYARALVAWAARAAAQEAVLPAVAAYVRAAPQAEALEFATGWALDAWDAYCAHPAAGTGQLAAATALAGLAIAHALDRASGPPLDKDAYNAAAEAARDLYLRLARSAPPEGQAPPGLLADLLARAQARAAELGFPPATAGRVPLLVRICRDFGRSLPRSAVNPGLRYLA